MLPLPLVLLVSTAVLASSRPLTGRFLHLTDMHPDPFYLYNASIGSACHSTKLDDKESDKAGYWGSEISDCDTPLSLINTTFAFLKDNFHSSGAFPLDFVVWTGDNARHDIDSRTPRSLPEIFKLNRDLASRMRDAFGDTTIVSSMGNNDIYPHNIMFAGPSAITSEFLDIWRHFIPESQKHTFARGGYYSVTPKQFTSAELPILIVSLNTLYMFENNKAVDGCPVYNERKGGPVDPGTEHLQWLEQQLLLARTSGKMVYLTGHVPPTVSNWYPLCYRGYSELVLRFHDTIVGQHFGHMNIDHFTFIQPPSKKHALSLLSEPITPFASSSSIANTLFSYYSALPSLSKPKKKHPANLSDFAVVHIGPSVIPTYLPSLRVWSYNTSIATRWRQPYDELLNSGSSSNATSREMWVYGGSAGDELEIDEEEDDNVAEVEGEHSPMLGTLLNILNPSPISLPSFPPSSSLRKHRKKKKRRRRKPTPPLPRHFSPDSPSMTNRFLTPLGYTQLVLDLEKANAHSGYGPGAEGRAGEEAGERRSDPVWEVEYTTYSSSFLAASLMGESSQAPVVDRGLFGNWTLEMEGDREGMQRGLEERGLTPYGLQSGTVGEWLRLGNAVGRGGKMWKGFLGRVFVGSGVEE